MKTQAAWLLLAMSGASFAADQAAAAPRALLEAKRCTVCHDERVSRIGPPFVQIARRYHGLDNAQARLVRTIRNGTDGPTPVYHFGSDTMPKENVRVPVSEDEAKQLADYILQLK